MKESEFTLNGRIWIEKGNERLLGKGRVELLERIHAAGSIRQAALQMKMSYKQAWDLVKHMNANFGSPVIISHRGGKGGGNAVVTERGQKVIMQFHELSKLFKEYLAQSNMEF